MSKDTLLDNFTKRFFSRTQKRELEAMPRGNKMPAWIRQLGRTVGIFIIAPLLTLLVLWILEMAFTDSAITALHLVFIRADVIFLAFSLALTVILEWTITANDGGAPTFFVVIEGVLGIVSLIFYVVEEVINKVTNSSVPESSTSTLMENRQLIHMILLLSVILVAVLGYCRRIMRKQKS